MADLARYLAQRHTIAHGGCRGGSPERKTHGDPCTDDVPRGQPARPCCAQVDDLDLGLM